MECIECKSTSFDELDGYNFCYECGRRNEKELVLTTEQDECDSETQTLDSENLEKLMSVSAYSSSIHLEQERNKEEASAKSKLTTVEEYNYILNGLVNELIQLGVDPKLKLVTLQLWTKYLRVNEIAFYDKSTKKIPKISSCFKKKDAEIIYNVSTKKRKNVHHDTEGSSNSSTSEIRRKRKVTSRKQKLFKLGKKNKTINSGNKCLESSLITHDSVNLSSNLSTHNKFSRMARHTFIRKIVKSGTNPEILGRSTLYEIIYLALNHIDSTVQLGDLIRFLREGHLTFTNISKFFPQNIDIQLLLRDFKTNSKTFPSHKYIRLSAARLEQMLNIELNIPDYNKLCSRYIRELCLPKDVYRSVEILLMIASPKMNRKGEATFSIPNYEGRAMAFVMFLLKLMFGLDGTREYKMSRRARKLNRRLNQLDSNATSIFVYDEWQKYIEMRNVILAQCHYPTCQQFNPNSTKSSYLYYDFAKQMDVKHQVSKKIHIKKKSHENALENIQTIFYELQKIHIETEDIEQISLSFRPSYTPKRAYLRELFKHPARKLIYIPDFMQFDYMQRDILPYLGKTSKLRSFFKNNNVTLIVKEIESSFEAVKFQSCFTQFYPKLNRQALDSNFFKYNFIDDDASHNELYFENNCKNVENDEELEFKILRKFHKLKNEIDAANKNKLKIQQNSLETEDDEYMSDNEQLSFRKNLNDNTTMFNYKIDDNDRYSLQQCSNCNYQVASNQDQSNSEFSSTSKDSNCNRTARFIDCDSDLSVENNDNQYKSSEQLNCKQHIEFLINNYDYWMYSGHMKAINTEQFEKMMKKEFSVSFQWLLKQCATMIECDQRQLYEELLVVENYFAYVLEDFSCINNQVIYQDRRKYLNSIGKNLVNCIKQLHDKW